LESSCLIFNARSLIQSRLQIHFCLFLIYIIWKMKNNVKINKDSI